jgi:hypothetical protein
MSKENKRRGTMMIMMRPWWCALIGLLLAFLSHNPVSGFGVNSSSSRPDSPSFLSELEATDLTTAVPSTSRRILNLSPAFAATWCLFPSSANALFGSREKRQLEVCIVSVLRVIYWAQFIASSLQQAETVEQRKQRYIEARLGAKALLTGKVGGGANGRVYALASLQLPEVLHDLQSYATSRQVEDLRQDFYESIAAVVEFDGLETLQDASPRSTLTLQQYNRDKAIYVERLLLERVVPVGEKLVNSFGPDVRQTCLNFIQKYYADEIPARPEPQGVAKAVVP